MAVTRHDQAYLGFLAGKLRNAPMATTGGLRDCHQADAQIPHPCAGNSVARIEARIAFGKLLERFPRFERAGPTVRPHRSRFRVVESLPVRLEPAS